MLRVLDFLAGLHLDHAVFNSSTCSRRHAAFLRAPTAPPGLRVATAAHARCRTHAHPQPLARATAPQTHSATYRIDATLTVGTREHTARHALEPHAGKHTLANTAPHMCRCLLFGVAVEPVVLRKPCRSTARRRAHRTVSRHAHDSPAPTRPAGRTSRELVGRAREGERQHEREGWEGLSTSFTQATTWARVKTHVNVKRGFRAVSGLLRAASLTLPLL